MKKFSKLFENKGELLTHLGSSEDDIKDMCSELIDEGYKLSIGTEYIGMNGRIYREPNKTAQYYPSIDIELHRKGDDEDPDPVTKDVRNWNGGVYYEGNLNLLKMIYELCYRFESTFTSDKADVFFSIRSINEVRIRVTFGIENSKSDLDFSVIREFITDGFLHSIDDDTYTVVDNFIWGDDKRMGVTIGNKRDSVPIKKIIDRIVKSGRPNDEEYLLGIFRSCVNETFNLCNQQNSKVVLRYNKSGDVAKIMIGDKTLIRFRTVFDVIKSLDVVVAKGIFKDKKVRVDALKMDIDITFNPDPEGKDLSTSINAI